MNALRSPRRAAAACLLPAAALFLSVCGPVPAPAAEKAAAKAPARSAWTTDFKAARELSRKTGKPLLLEFYAEWCGPCKMMAQTTFRDPQIQQLVQKFVPVRINVDQQKELAAKYDPDGVLPRTLVLAPDGKVKRSSGGYHKAEEFALFLKQAL